MRFFALIIGTEILNDRREDKHLPFLKKELANYGYSLEGVFFIADKSELIINTISLVASMKDAVLLSFGGIGSTPDDLTRECAAIALRDGNLHEHEKAKEIIENKLGEKAYPHAINMAYLPKNSDIIDNPFNGMPAFSLDNRFFFMPGFPEMSHPMSKKILASLIKEPKKTFRHSLTALCKESEFIEIMHQVPSDVECSSLPKIYSDGPRAVLSVSSENKQSAKDIFDKFIMHLDKKNIIYSLRDEEA
jgi:molybdopterin-biosynthesis enzyme MoeA-like protein